MTQPSPPQAGTPPGTSPTASVAAAYYALAQPQVGGLHGLITQIPPSTLQLLPDFDLLGFNYRMTDLQGAVGQVQLRKLDEFIAERQRWAYRIGGAAS